MKKKVRCRMDKQSCLFQKVLTLTLATPTPVNLASSSSCLRGSRLCNSSIISAAVGEQQPDYAMQGKERFNILCH